MTTFFTSDTHYYHDNVIRYSKRPFKDVEEMNEALITNYNSVVKASDDVYHLGDFAFAKSGAIENILRRLNGRKHLIFGNHDKHLRKHKELLSKHFIWAKDYAEIKVEEQSIILSHYSFRVWNKWHYGSWIKEKQMIRFFNISIYNCQGSWRHPSEWCWAFFETCEKGCWWIDLLWLSIIVRRNGCVEE